MTRRNCWTCAHDRDHRVCAVAFKLRGSDQIALRTWSAENTAENGMPPKTADNCPGYEPTGQPAPEIGPEVLAVLRAAHAVDVHPAGSCDCLMSPSQCGFCDALDANEKALDALPAHIKALLDEVK